MPADLPAELLAYLLPRTGTVGLKELSKSVQLLSEQFNRFAPDPDIPVPDYWRDPALLAAYQAYFLPVNAVRTHSVLDEIRRAGHSIRNRETLRAVDLGSGPGSASAGLLLHLAATRSVNPIAVELTCIDRSTEALRAAVETLAELRRTLPPWGVRPEMQTRSASLENDIELNNPDLIIAANVLVELSRDSEDPIGSRVARLRGWYEQLTPGGMLVVIEPSLKDVSRDLHRVRDRLLEETDADILAPCPGRYPCPILAHDQHWCHEQFNWERPEIIREIDKRAGLDKRKISYSFFVLARPDQSLPSPTNRFRVLSSRKIEKGKMRIHLCGGETYWTATALKRERNEQNEVFWNLRRGDWVEILDTKTSGSELRIETKSTVTLLAGE